MKINVEMTHDEYLEYYAFKNPSKDIEIGNVVENINTDDRFCIRNTEQLSEVIKHKQSYKFICEHDHADGRYDYLCNSSYCRCSD